MCTYFHLAPITSFKIRERLSADGVEVPPLVIFAKDAHFALEKLADSGYDMMGLDWTVPPSDGRRRTNDITLQGERSFLSVALPFVR